MPCAAYGFSAEWAQRAVRTKRDAPPGHSGIGTTLTGNPMSLTAMRATLSELMTDSVYAPMLKLSTQLAQGLREVIARRGLPWCVTQLGARCEFQFRATPPRNGTQAGDALDADLEHLIHLALLNRGVLITPFHNMLLVCPQTTSADVARLLAAFDEVLGDIGQA